VNLGLPSEVWYIAMNQQSSYPGFIWNDLTLNFDAPALERHDKAALQLVLRSAQLGRCHTSSHGSRETIELVPDDVPDRTGKVWLYRSGDTEQTYREWSRSSARQDDRVNNHYLVLT
jgi:hypothetical protein